jgi:hypothetical protein
MSARVAGTTSIRPNPTYTTLRDVTSSAFSAAAPANAQPRVFTVAGSSSKELTLPFDGGLATEREMFADRVVAEPGGGFLVIAEEMLRVDPAGRVAPVRGSRQLEWINDVASRQDGSLLVADESGVARLSGDGAVRRLTNPRDALARLSYFEAIAALPDGSALVVDSVNDRVLKMTSDGRLTVAAGNGRHGYAGDGGLAVRARLSNPLDVAVLSDGSFAITEGPFSRRRVRLVDQAGVITTIAGGGGQRLVGRCLANPVAATSVRLAGMVRTQAAAEGGLLLTGSPGLLALVGGELRSALPCGAQASDPAAPRYPDGRLAEAAVLPDVDDVAVGSGGELLLAAGGRIGSVLDEGSARFAAALGPATLRTTRLGRVELFTTDAATVVVELRKGGRRKERVAVAVPAGRSVLRLPRAPSGGGIYELRLRAESPDGRVATHRLRVLAAHRVPVRLARRLMRRRVDIESDGTLTGVVDRCRRRGPRTVTCRVRVRDLESLEPERGTGRMQVLLRTDGVPLVRFRNARGGRLITVAAEF